MTASTISAIKEPYPGFRPFAESESEIFFGRDGQTGKMVSKLVAQRFLAVVGTSGSGKSSLVIAGLVPAARGGFLPGPGAGWRIALFQPLGEPHHDPWHNLAAAARLDEVVLQSHSLGLVSPGNVHCVTPSLCVVALEAAGDDRHTRETPFVS